MSKYKSYIYVKKILNYLLLNKRTRKGGSATLKDKLTHTATCIYIFVDNQSM